MKAVCEALRLARSHFHNLKHRAASWSDGRKARVLDDSELVAEVREQLAELPSYGYQRACGLVNRQRVAMGEALVNAKPVYRVMAAYTLLLPRAPRRRHSGRPHSGKVGVEASNLRWCSDGFEVRCDSAQVVTVTFAKDCCDREVMAWPVWVDNGLLGEPVRDMLIEAVEKRFGAVDAIPAQHALEFLSNKGGSYIAHYTRKIARALGLTPIQTPVCSALQQWHRQDVSSTRSAATTSAA